MVRNLLLTCLSLSLFLGASGCNQNEDQAASDEQFAVAIAAPLAVGAWFTMETGLTIAALAAVNSWYIQRTGATPGGFIWDFLTISDPKSRARLITGFGGSNLSSEERAVARVVMKTVNEPPAARPGFVVKPEVRGAQSSECREATKGSADKVAIAGASCTQSGLTCEAAIRSLNNGRGGDNWTPGVCTCNKNRDGKLLWRECKDPNGAPVAYYVGGFEKVWYKIWGF